MSTKTPTRRPDDDEAEDIGFIHAVLAQVGLPRNPTAARTFTRTNGSASLRLEAGAWWDGVNWIDQPLPSGTRPRLVLIHACSEAIRTGSPEVEVEHSVRAFLRRLGIDQGGKTMKAFRLQMLALAACRLTLGYATATKTITAKADPISEFHAWVQNDDDGQVAMWPGVLRLSDAFFKTLEEFAVPLDQGAVAKLQSSALALDCYTWLAHRLCRVTSSSGTTLSWHALQRQFGQEYKSTKDFKREFVKAIARALEAYPAAKVSKVRGGFKLLPSAPPIARKGHLVMLPKPDRPKPVTKAAKPTTGALPKPAAVGRSYVSEDALNAVRQVAPGWDRQALLRKYMDWISDKEQPNNIDQAFLGWAKRYTKGRPPA